MLLANENAGALCLTQLLHDNHSEAIALWLRQLLTRSIVYLRTRGVGALDKALTIWHVDLQQRRIGRRKVRPRIAQIHLAIRHRSALIFLPGESLAEGASQLQKCEIILLKKSTALIQCKGKIYIKITILKLFLLKVYVYIHQRNYLVCCSHKHSICKHTIFTSEICMLTHLKKNI